MDGIPGAKQTPHWEEFPVNPHEKPETPFSVSRALPGVIKSNAELVDIMASAAGLNSRQATSVRVQITWWDAMGDEQNRPVLNGCTGTVTGGRLGRDHTLEDVPNHYVRDRVMDYINTQLDEEKRESTRKAVFSDLSAAEILEYASLIEKQREECEEEKKKKQQIVGNILGCRHVRSEEEAAHVWDQADVMDDIDVNIDLMPQPDFTSLTCDQKMSGSVMKPGFEPSPSETNVDVGTEIDRNCDQIRAMIKLLTLHGSWTVDQFRLALGHISRSQLTNFLRKRGPMEGIHTLSFQLGWEFFKKREVLGIPNSGALQNALEHQGALQERDPNRGQKRPTTGTGKDDEPVKHTRTTRSGDKSTKANA
ncbi:hypothetical protein F4677DRAFT_362519 [Hypoxylon crocopeplum]|nr:hypothetical protein F4677DRAFT_362519 [Hypoxylon crocopeplum]